MFSVNKGKFIRPIEQDFVMFLYDLYQGKIRFVMDAIASIISYLPTGVMKTLPLDSAKTLLSTFVLEKLRLTLTNRELEILTIASQLEFFTNSDLSKKSKIESRNISKYLHNLLNLNYIRQHKREGKRIYYVVTEDVKILTIDSKSSKESSNKTNNKDQMDESFTKREKELIKYINKKKTVTVKEWAERNKLSLPSARKDIQKLEKCGYFLKKGYGRNTHYILK